MNRTPPTTAELQQLVARLAPHRADATRNDWIKVGMAIHHADSSDVGYGLWEDFSRQSPKFNLKDCQRAWKSFKPGAVTFATLIKFANDDDPSGRQRPQETPMRTTKRDYTGLDDYANAHGVHPDALRAAGWSETRHDSRPALKFTTTTGTRWRFLDGEKPAYDSPFGFKRCWYGLEKAVALAKRTNSPLVLVNGEASAVAAQHHGIAACAIAGGTEKTSLPEDLRDEMLNAYDGPIVIALDCDDQGRNAARGILAQLRELGVDARAVDLQGSHGFDIADYCILHNGTSATAIHTLPDLKMAEFAASSPSVHPTPRLLPRHALGSITPTTWLIDGVLAMNKLSQTFAPPGSGKSFTELDKALCVAQQYPVIYVAAEAVEDYHERVTAWEAYHGQQAGDIYFWPEPITLKDPASVDAFLTEIHPIAPAAIFIDPLASCMVGLEESSTGDMTIAVEALNRIRRETGAAVHVVHHTGWSDAHERGSSVLRAACRIVMKLSMDDSGLMTLSCEKANNGKPFEARHFRLMASADSAVVVPANKMSMRNAPLSEKQFAIMEALDLLHFRDGATFSQIQEHTNLAKSTVNKAISRLMELGSISFEKVGRSTTYRNTPKGNAELTARLSSTVAGASSPVHQEGELMVNWMVNNLGTPRPNAEFTQFTIDSEKQALVHPMSEQNGSPEFTSDTASECASSPQFTSSSPSVHPIEFTSSPRVCSLEHAGSELETGEPPTQPFVGHDVARLNRPKLNVNTRLRMEAEAAAMVRDEDNL